MTNTKLSQEPVNGSPAATDEVLTVQNPGGTPSTSTATIANIFKAALLAILTTSGDVIFNSSGVPTRLGVGANGMPIIAASGLPAWATPSSLFCGGWIPDNNAWTYASAVTVTVSGDVTPYVIKGLKVRLTDASTVKYFYVQSAVYSNPNTTITLNGGTDYTLSGGAITLPYFSDAENPVGFPDWFNFNAAPAGYSSVPTAVTYRFCIKGQTVFAYYAEKTYGVSNLTTKTYNLPVTAKSPNANEQWCGIIPVLYDNGAAAYTGEWVIAASGTTMSCFKNALTAWTGSGNCEVFGNGSAAYGCLVVYEMA